ncbi:MAG: hypothetical protein IJP70_01655 [Bacteroidales bacterium]|nr:hypothetical protein [Bacteroidales bacterium]
MHQVTACSGDIASIYRCATIFQVTNTACVAVCGLISNATCVRAMLYVNVSLRLSLYRKSIILTTAMEIELTEVATITASSLGDSKGDGVSSRCV